MSPLASHAQIVITCDAKGIDRFDSLVSGHVVVDIIISQVYARLGRSAHKRLQAWEAIRAREPNELMR